MNVGGVRVGRVSEGERGELLKGAEGAEVTYGHVGSTLEATTTGYRRRQVLGNGDEDFGEACKRLRAWASHRNIGALVHPENAPIEEGGTVLVELRQGPVTIPVPCRIVEVIDEPHRFGFAYGTLPGHVETGEESFLIEQGADGTVTGTITVDAKPATLVAKLGSPVVTAVQRWAARRYLSALVVR